MEEFFNKITSEQFFKKYIEQFSSVESFQQYGIVFVAFIAGFITIRYTARILSERTKSKGETPITPFLVALQKVSMPLVAGIILYIFHLFHNTVENPEPIIIIDVVMKLAIAWSVITFVTSFTKYRVIVRWFAILAWAVVALMIIGIYDDVTKELDSVIISAGETKVSLLTMMQGVVYLILFLWIAVATSKFLERQIMESALTPSLRVLFSKILRIILIATALLITINNFGIDLTALAVFSGALGVGLGFGLQKIVSNFISGIILLMDRSIKPGDVIGINDTYGWVNKLSTRHVSVITRDNIEHLIPNELLITERVENWSYSDNNVRVRVPFGVHYNSDLHKVIEMVIEAVGEIPRVLEKPKPVCLVTDFGDSSVNFELRVWINDPSGGVGNIKSKIYLAIWDKFKENNIEIPYPQRDIYIKEHPDPAPKKKAAKKK